MTESPRFSPDVPELHRPYTADESRYQQFAYRQVGSSGLYLPPISLGLWSVSYTHLTLPTILRV